jgi:hypothetical protein
MLLTVRHDFAGAPRSASRRGFRFRRRFPKNSGELGAPEFPCLPLWTEVLPAALKRAAAFFTAMEGIEAEAMSTGPVREITSKAMNSTRSGDGRLKKPERERPVPNPGLPLRPGFVDGKVRRKLHHFRPGHAKILMDEVKRCNFRRVFSLKKPL